MSGRVKAPWTAEQVKNLNDFQEAGIFHEFCCGGKIGGADCHAVLIATENGWVCPVNCGYTQDWANDFMTNGSWRVELERLKSIEQVEASTPTLRVYTGADGAVIHKKSYEIRCEALIDKNFTCTRYPEWDFHSHHPLHPEEIVQSVCELVAEFYDRVMNAKRSPFHLYIFTLSEVVLRTICNLVRNGLLDGIKVEFVWYDKDLEQITVPLDAKGEMTSPWPDDMFDMQFNLLFHGVPKLRPEVLEQFIKGREALKKQS